MSLSSVRRQLYRTASLLGDVEAVRRGPRAVAHRLFRKVIMRAFFSAMRGRW